MGLTHPMSKLAKLAGFVKHFDMCRNVEQGGLFALSMDLGQHRTDIFEDCLRR
jgi:hypothetical protein